MKTVHPRFVAFHEKIDDLMQQISALRKEYDEKNTFTQEIPVLNENDEIVNNLNK